MQYRFLYVMVPTREEGMNIARTLVKEKKVACANVVVGASSVYWWEGRVQESEESVLIAKTTEALVDTAIARVKELHSYICPGVVSLPIAESNPDFLKWIGESVSSEMV